ncbi:response regulator [Desulfobacterales bacterium HSG16]|nr:response regulator [Desulfobacterales bacterium HSG16]
MKKQYSLLIIDDEPGIIDAYGRYFKKRGFRVDNAQDGQSGLNKLLDGEYDVALVDLRMPELDGIKVIQQAVEADVSASLVILTGHGEKQDAVDAVNYGADAWFDKGSEDMKPIFDKVKALAEGMPLDDISKALANLSDEA